MHTDTNLELLAVEEFVELVLTETATAANVHEKLKLDTQPIENGSAFSFLVLSLLLLRSKKAKHLAVDEAKKGKKADGASWLPKPETWRARCW